MMGLKTLKDCGTDTRFCSKLPMFARSELRTELKQEAIKEIKCIRGFGCGKVTEVLVNKKPQICGDKEYSPRPLCKICITNEKELDIPLHQYIIRKFNITEEDLK